MGQPAYGVPVGPDGFMGPQAAAYGVPVGAPGQAPMATAAGPMGPTLPGMMYGYPGPLGHSSMVIGTQQDHDLAAAGTCCCGKWGVLGTLLCCPSFAGIAGMFTGCGVNLIVGALLYMILLTASTFMVLPEGGPNPLHGHSTTAMPVGMADLEHHRRHHQSQPNLVAGCLMMTAMIMVGMSCIMSGRVKYAQWQALRDDQAQERGFPIAVPHDYGFPYMQPNNQCQTGIPVATVAHTV